MEMNYTLLVSLALLGCAVSTDMLKMSCTVDTSVTVPDQPSSRLCCVLHYTTARAILEPGTKRKYKLKRLVCDEPCNAPPASTVMTRGSQSRSSGNQSCRPRISIMLERYGVLTSSFNINVKCNGSDGCTQLQKHVKNNCHYDVSRTDIECSNTLNKLTQFLFNQ